MPYYHVLLSMLAAVVMLASAEIPVFEDCQGQYTWFGDSCAAGSNCVLYSGGSWGICLRHQCATTVAPEATLWAEATTTTVNFTTTAIHAFTSTVAGPCQCNPTFWYTTTLTQTAAPGQYTPEPNLGECKKYPNNKCPAGAECVERFSTDTYSYSECRTVECLDTLAPTTTWTHRFTVTEAAPSASTITVTDTATRQIKTPSGTTCSCSPGPATGTITYYESPAPTPFP